jgi:protoheme IX farnesyltransferase
MGSRSRDQPHQPGVVSSIVELTKPGIVRMVLVAASVGFILGAIRPDLAGGGAAFSIGQFITAAAFMLVGTALAAGGANALNMALEVWRDAQMERTADRPVPSGRIAKPTAMSIGLLLASVGTALLAVGAGLGAAAVVVLTVLLYTVAYTPLKPVTTLSTIVGAAPGALPPLVGWCAAATLATGSPWAGLLEPGGWSLFALMFVWQVPHVMAISWKYREQYARGGYRVLPAIDPSGHRTGRAALAWSVALLPMSLAPVVALPEGTLGVAYIVVALAAGLWFVSAAADMAHRRTTASATKLFVVSIVYLPAVLFVMVLDAVAWALLA